MTVTLHTRTKWRLASVTFACTFAAMACFDHVRDWNSATRLLLTHAIVDDASMETTQYVSKDGRLLEHPPTRDLARTADGKYYCDKPPGQSLLGTAAYWKLRNVFGYPRAIDVAGHYEPSDYWVTLFTSGLATALTAALLVVFLSRLGVSPLASASTAVAYAWTTHAAVYGTLFYSHACAGLLILGSLFALSIPSRNERGGDGGTGRGGDGQENLLANAIAGLLAGTAVAFEYTAALFVAVVIVVWLVGMLGERRSSILPLALFIGAMLPSIVALAWYHWRITGDPLSPPYSLEVDPEFAYHRERTVPISLPSTEAALALLFSFNRGLIWNAPIVLGAIPGLVILWRQGRRRLASVIAFTSLGLFLAIAGFPSWHGGWTTGPRLLLPSLPLLVVAAGVWLGWRPRLPNLQWVDSALKLVMVFACVFSFVRITMLNIIGGRLPPSGPGAGLFDRSSITTEPHAGSWIANAIYQWWDLGMMMPVLEIVSIYTLLVFLGCIPLVVAFRSRRR